MNEEDRDFYKGLKTDARELLSFYLKPFLLFWKTLLLLWKLLPFFLVILFFLLSGVTIYWMWEAFVFEKMAERLNFENSPSAFVIFSKGDSPSTLSVRVLDMKGNPLPQEHVGVHGGNGSGGWSIGGDTDTKGEVRLEVRSYSFDSLTLNKEVVLEPSTENTPREIGFENCSQILIVKKNTPDVPTPKTPENREEQGEIPREEDRSPSTK